MIPQLEFHHIGYACRAIDAELGHFLALGYVHDPRYPKRFVDVNQRVSGLFLLKDSLRLELLEPTDDQSPLHDYLKRQSHMYHQGFLARDFDGAIEALVASGAKRVSPPKPAVAFDFKKVTFLMLRNRFLVELIEA